MAVAASEPASIGEFAWTDDQNLAFYEIMNALQEKGHHLLTGSAGSGKTTLMQRVTQELLVQGKTVVLCAPTHKAVAVLDRKLREAGIEAECKTIQSLLSLMPIARDERVEFVRRKGAGPVLEDVVIVDECSMLSSGLMAHIHGYLDNSAILFSGDQAQLPPVGEVESESFSTPSRSHLETIVRQAQENPILAITQALRACQKAGEMDWSWCRPAHKPPMGVYLPGPNLDSWLKKAFTSPEFDANPDSFRYLAWTNDRVAKINAQVRRWRYGDEVARATPFAKGERILFRSALAIHEDILFNTNDEASLVDIGQGTYTYMFGKTGKKKSEAWAAQVPSWQMVVKRDDGTQDVIHMPSDTGTYNRIIARIVDEARKGDSKRWEHLHQFKASMAVLQAVYALTIHTSQGSTFERVFVDVANIRQRERGNLLEMQQLLYVAATRPSLTLILAGV